MGQQCCVAVDPTANEHNAYKAQVIQDEKDKNHPTEDLNKINIDVARMNQQKLEEIQAKIVEEQKKEEEWLKKEEELISKEQQSKEQFVDFHHIIHLYQKSQYFYKNHDLDTACDFIKEIQVLKFAIMQKRSLKQDEFMQLLRKSEEAWQKDHPQHIIHPYDVKFIQDLQSEMKDMLFYFNATFGAPFIQRSNEDGVKISTRKQTSSIGALIQCQLHVPFQHFAAILYEVNYYTEFLPYCEKSALIKDIARNSKIGHVVLNFPFIAKRQAYFQGCAIFRLNHSKDIFIYTRSIHDKPELQKQYGVQTPLNKKYVPLDYKYFILNYQPIREGVGNLKFAFNIDNGVHFLPEFIQEYVTRQFAKQIFHNILKICKKFKGSKWEQSMIDNPQFLMFVKESIKERLERIKEEAQKQQK